MDSHYTKIHNWILEDLFRADFNGSTFRVALFIFRMTIGYQKESEKLSINRISSETGLSRDSVVRAIKTLKAQNWIKVTTKKSGQTFFETNSIKWIRGSSKSATRGSSKSALTPYAELQQLPLKVKGKPHSDRRLEAPSSGNNLNKPTIKELNELLGDEYE